MCAQSRLERDEGPDVTGTSSRSHTRCASGLRAALSAPCASRFAVSIEGHFPQHAATFLPMLRDNWAVHRSQPVDDRELGCARHDRQPAGGWRQPRLERGVVVKTRITFSRCCAKGYADCRTLTSGAGRAKTTRTACRSGNHRTGGTPSWRRTSSVTTR